MVAGGHLASRAAAEVHSRADVSALRFRFLVFNAATLWEKVFTLFNIRASGDSQITAVSARATAASKREHPTSFLESLKDKKSAVLP